MGNSVVAVTASADAEGVDVDYECRKRSFLKLPVAVDIERLRAEFASAPEAAWGVSHWDNHCSIDVMQLRGGGRGVAQDYVCDDAMDAPVLKALPYMASLIGSGGPFGAVSYAVIFRTKPFGMARVHTDDHDAWTRNVRIHIPIVTNPEAVLLVEGRAQHFGAGEVWTFDNQAPHAVMNGETMRAHVILDVLPNPRLANLMRGGELVPGTDDPARWRATCEQPDAYRFARGEPLSREEKTRFGLAADSFAGRVTRIGKKARLFRHSPLKVGDILTAVNGVTSSHLSRSAIDFVFRQARAGELVTLEGLRDGRAFKARVTLVPIDHFDAKPRFRRFVKAVAGR